MRILIGCEESQAVCKEFRKLGFEAYSCDILDCSGDMPQYHIKGDIFETIELLKPDVLIAFPPCTHLTVAGAVWWEEKKKLGVQDDAINFFLKIANLDIPYIAIENPVGIMNKLYRKPDQIIQPYYFGDGFSKRTCLWLKGLPKLYHNDWVNLFDTEITHVNPGEWFYWNDSKTGKLKRIPMWYHRCWGKKDQAKLRSKTFPGIANAMATQWGNFLNSKTQ